MDRLLAIRVFGRVVETGSFTGAADALQMPKSTVTKLIQALEADLRIRLLERTTRRVTVTAEGAAYYERTRQLVTDLDDFETELTAGPANPQGELRIDTGGSVAAGLILPGLADFRARYPGIHVRVGVTDRTVDLIGEGIDCAIRSTGDDPNLVTRRIAGLPWCLCASPDYLDRHGIPTTPDEIVRDGHTVVGYFSTRSGRTQPLRLSDGDRVIELAVPEAVSVNESNAHTAAALAGLGLVQTLAFTVAPHVASGALVALMADRQPPPLPVYLVYPPGRQHNARLRAFIEWISQELPARAEALRPGVSA